jgi:hypothetical protein
MSNSETSATTQSASITDINSTKPKSKPTTPWRDILPIHPAAELFPLMSPDELRELGENIRKNGLQIPIVACSGNGSTSLVDGRNRLDGMDDVGILRIAGRRTLEYRNPTGEWVRVPSTSLPEDTDPYAFVFSANLARRHLSAEQKRDIIAKLLKSNPEKSDRRIAEIAKDDHKKVGRVRADLEARGALPHVETRADSKGRQQPSTKPKKQRDADGASRVYDIAAPTRLGTVTTSGPEVSEVKWDNGRTSYVSNDHLRSAEGKAEHEAKAALPVTEAVVNPAPEPTTWNRETVGLVVQGAIAALIDASKQVVNFENLLPADLVHPKSDIDEVIVRLNRLNKTMAKRRRRGRPRKADCAEVAAS